MELVKGVPITDYCDQNHLTPRERLELFVSVCHAVQHAHQKGIIHRDLKPSNVLVSRHDATPVVKVIDFGVAKALGPELAEKTLFTGIAQMIGTPMYMSPEQAGMSDLDIDTRSDIYSLGVLLYELLTGTTPFDKQRFKQAAYDEIRRIIREEEPPKPSTRLSESKDQLPSISAQRHTEPAKLTKLVRGELDWIVMKALEKDRSRRYETANGFAADVQRYLADESVQACPPSVGYRFRKFARRNKAAFAIAGLILFLVLTLGSGAGWVVRDRAARRTALEQEVSQALADVENASQRQRLTDALAALKQAEGLLAGGRVSDVLQERVRRWQTDLHFVTRLEKAWMMGFEVNVFSDRPSPERAVPEYEAVFRDYGLEIGRVNSAEAAQRIRAMPPEMQPTVVAALDRWLELKRGETSKDPLVLAQLQAILKAVDTDPWRVEMRAAFGKEGITRKRLMELAASPDFIKQTPSTQLRLGWLLWDSGKREDGLAVMQRAQRQHPGDFWINSMLAYVYTHQASPSRHEEAVRFASICVALQPDNAWALCRLGLAYEKQGKPDEAMMAYRQAIALKPDYRGAHGRLGVFLRNQGKPQQAIVEFERVIELKADKRGDANAYLGLGACFIDLGKLDDAIEACRQAIKLKPDYADAYHNLGEALREKGNLEAAMEAWQQALKLTPEHILARNSLATAHARLGDAALIDQGKLQEAIEAYRQAIKLKPDFVHAHFNLGVALARQGKLDEAIGSYREAVKHKADHAEAYYGLGDALERQGKLDDAGGAYRQALKHKPDYAEVHHRLGNTLERQGKLPEAIAAYRQACKLAPHEPVPHGVLGDALYAQGELEEAIAAYRHAIKLKADYFQAHYWLGMALRKQGQLDEAIVAYRKVIELKPDNHAASCQLAWLLATCADPKLRDPRQALELAKKGIEFEPEAACFWQILGWAHYRAGAWKASIEALEKSMVLQKRPKGGDSYQWFFLAMAHWQLGNTQEARKWYDRAVEWMNKNQSRNEELRRFRTEAAELLGVHEKK
jgi:tetratricopeptide (TPR) repeat protein